jgi:RimJ/RimL family protein N-acetyltransferase
LSGTVGPGSGPIVLETARLTLRKLTLGDAEFILGLLNEPSFLRFIGDKGVRNLDDARDYLLKGPIASYEQFGFGLFLTQLKEGRVPIGMCGLLKRPNLEDVDVGFAFLPQFWSKGYASESASAVVAFGKSVFGLQRIVGLVRPGNQGSIRVLEKLGLRFDRIIRIADDGTEDKLFA